MDRYENHGKGEGGVIGDVTRYWVAMPASSIKIEVVLAADYDALRRVADGLREIVARMEELLENQPLLFNDTLWMRGHTTVLEACQHALAAADAVLGK